MSEAEETPVPWDDEPAGDGPPLPLPAEARAEAADADGEDAEVHLPDKPVVAPVAELVAVEDIYEMENSRTALGDIKSLAENIRVRGLLHPVVIRPAQDKGHGHPYELIAGYRRLAAFRELARPQIPAVIHEASDQEMLAELISENQERENPTPVDEARTMQRMIDVFGWSHRQVAAQLGVDKSQVTKRLGLLRLPDKVQTMVSEGKLTASHAEVIARLDNPESQEELADLAVKSEAPVSKLNGYASRIKERDEEKLEASDPEVQPEDPEKPMDMVAAEDVVPLPRLIVRAELSGEEIARANLYALLRTGHDQEMLDTLAERFGVAFHQLWEWVEALSDEQVVQMNETMVRRWLGAAHRYPTFPESLRARFGEAEGVLGDGGPVELPEGVGAPEDWNEDWDEWADDDDDVF